MPPTFNIVVEIQERDKVAIHPDVGAAVDAILRGHPIPKEIRWRDESGEIHTEMEKEKEIALPGSRKPFAQERPQITGGNGYRVFLFGVDKGRLEQIAREMRQNMRIVNNLDEANLFVTSKSYYRRKPQRLRDAESANIPIYVLRSSTQVQMRQMLSSISSLGKEVPMEKEAERPGSVNDALKEAETAVDRVRGGQEMVELSPQVSYIRRLQHVIAERHNLASDSIGKEPERHVRIFRGRFGGE